MEGHITGWWVVRLTPDRTGAEALSSHLGSSVTVPIHSTLYNDFLLPIFLFFVVLMLTKQRICLWEWVVNLGLHKVVVRVATYRFKTTWLTIWTPTQAPEWLALVASGSEQPTGDCGNSQES